LLQELQSARVDLYIDQGDSYYKVFTVKNSLGIVIDLTGLSVECSVKRYYNTHKSYNMRASIASAVEGKILLQMTEQDSRALYEDRYVYSVRLRDNTMAVTIMDGQILVTNTVLSTSEIPVLVGGVQTTMTVDTPNV
jgi:hypothetical protein